MIVVRLRMGRRRPHVGDTVTLRSPGNVLHSLAGGRVSLRLGATRCGTPSRVLFVDRGPEPPTPERRQRLPPSGPRGRAMSVPH